MNTKVFVAVALTLVLAGCAGGRIGTDGFNPLMVTRPDPQLPNIFVDDNGYLVVDQEPIRIPRSVGRVVILWALAYHGTTYTFPDDGIRIVDPVTNGPPPGLECGTQGTARKVYRCAYNAPLEPKKYKYTIKVNSARSPLDPWIFHD